MRFSKEFDRDYNWFLSVSSLFNFDGVNEYINKRGEDIIVCDNNGLTAKECFYLFDSKGEIKPCREPNLLYTLLNTKGSVNLHIKMYAEDRARGRFPLIEFRGLCIKFKAPSWFRKAVEEQKHKYYDTDRANTHE